jgi:hypothetical protein
MALTIPAFVFGAVACAGADFLIIGTVTLTKA